MGEKALVESKIVDAISLIQKLDADSDTPSMVAWYLYDDVDEWRLLVAGPTFDKLLPKQEAIAYRKLVDAIVNLSLISLTVSDLKLVATNSPLPQAVRLVIRTTSNVITQAHFTNNTINGIFIKEMIILRSA